MARPNDNTPAAWPAVIAVLTLVGLAVGVHLDLKRQGLPIQGRREPKPCAPADQVSCSDGQRGERMVRNAE